MIVVCLGMPGSASTWTFNVVRDLLAVADGPVAGFEATSLAAVEAALLDYPQSLVIRAHTLSAPLLALVAAAGGRFVVTTRDPRDCVASLRGRLGGDAASWAMDVARSLAAVGTVLRRPGIAPLAFEDGFASDPETGPRLAARLGLSLDPGLARQIAAGWSPGRVRGVLASLAQREEPNAAGFRSDPATGFNEAHLGDGRVAKWADVLPPAEAAAIDRCFGALRPLQHGLGAGDTIRFGEALFSPAARADDPADTGPGPFGVPLLRFCYLAAGRWRLSLRGRLPGAELPRWLSLVVGGRRVLAHELEGGAAPCRVEASCLLEHDVHEHMIEVRLEDAAGRLPDPHRPEALELAAERL